MKLVITANGFQKPEMKPVIEKAQAYFDTVVLNPWGRRGTQEEISQIWDGADAIVCGAEQFDQKFLDDAPSTLKVLSRYGVGVDNIDIPACEAKGIQVCNTPGANADSVAEMAMCLMMACARQVVNHDEHTRRGEWKRFPTLELKGKRLGLVGFGAIGRGVARRARAFGMEVVAYDPYFNEAAAAELNVTKVTLEDLFRSSDVISLHLPSTPATWHLINAETLAQMKPGTILLNTARGELIDEEALVCALKENRLRAAGLDVYEHEPLHESPLFELENVTLMPHCSATTPDAAVNMGMMAVENAYRALNGLENAHIVHAK
ncbi:MAG: phosphoglycerate dehydrogenase [Victivallales bacterium]|nr:phosphoglycerate dehydrogenase [Victivallales bacterium]